MSIEDEEESMIIYLWKASTAGRIHGCREPQEDEPDRDIYLTEIGGDALIIKFSSAALA